MILRMLTFMLVLGTSPLFAGGERGSALFTELGGLPGVAGVAGIPGVPGASAALEFADFFAVNPPQAQAGIPVGSPIAFPTTGSTFGEIIPNGTGTVFTLTNIGTYLIEFQVSVNEGIPNTDEAVQLELILTPAGNPPNLDTVVGRSTGTEQIVGFYYVTTTTASTTLSLVNQSLAGNNITITPFAGSANVTTPSTAHLVITRVL